MLNRYAFHQSQVEAPEGNILLHALVHICFEHLLTVTSAGLHTTEGAYRCPTLVNVANLEPDRCAVTS